MNWYNKPQHWQEQGNSLIVQCEGKTDFWRVTRHNFIKDDAHYYYEKIEGDFTVTVKIAGDYATLYDQAGLMIRENKNTWMKCGIEYLDGIQQASAVITREFSDWSIVPLSDNPKSIWIQAKRIGEAIEVYFSRDGETFTMIRQGYLSISEKLQVGMMCAAPTGNGFKVKFEDFSIRTSL